MAKIYAELIKKGLKSIDDVPKILKKEVEDLLKNENKPTLYDSKK